ncbi:MAG: GDP-mannose 4,6-dehydratase [Oligoflexia bacterium]|nr:GDP-mannose 4,6-dehydratase [Oligoflexia bacterium]
MKHVVITGGAGFIGSHLSELFISKGYAVTAVDNFLTGSEANIEGLKKNENFRFVRKDVCELSPDGKEIELIARHGLQGVLHFACPASPVDFDRLPFEILAVDSIGTMRTVDLASKFGARYLLASTSESYGDPLVHPQTEDYWGNVNPVGPRACYDETKRFAEAYVSTAARLGVQGKKFNAGIVRIFNTYGPRMRPDDGRLVPELCMRALKGLPMTIHGDGLQTRSFCYVTDLIDGIFRLFESDRLGPVNIGNPDEHTILDFVEILGRLTGSASAVTHLPARPDDPRKRRPDISRARGWLGWAPVVKLEDGLRKSLEFFRSSIKG